MSYDYRPEYKDRYVRTRKFKCARCGKTGTLRGGHILAHGPNIGKYYCNPCLRKLDGDSAQKMITAALKDLPPQPSPPSPQDELKKMLSMLEDRFLPSPRYLSTGWYRLKDLTAWYNRRCSDFPIGEKHASNILHRLGFVERRTMGQGFTGVWIDVDTIRWKVDEEKCKVGKSA